MGWSLPSAESRVGQPERCAPNSNSDEPCRPSCESCGADTCAESNLTRSSRETPLVATTRPNPPSQATQVLDLIQALRQNDSPIRTHFAQVGLIWTMPQLRNVPRWLRSQPSRGTRKALKEPVPCSSRAYLT